MAQGKRRESRGVRGGRRAHRQHHGQSQDPRRIEALEKARAEQAALDARLAAERVAEVERSEREARDRHAADQRRLAADRVAREMAEHERSEQAARKREQWTLGQARALIRQGYSVKQASALTGWEKSWLDDVESPEYDTP